MLRSELGEEVKVYLVGGAVRDLLLGLEPKDRDYVVVGATPELMLEKGFQQVGADFPVFLHPETNEEYALARTERKTSPGYNGFVTDHSPKVTLRDDLERRDLTVNAMAMTSSGQVIDYFGGTEDLQSGILRHVGPAFAEDPVRVLRVARFAARYDWMIAAETTALMRHMVNSGELNHLTRERVYKEFEKGFSEKLPSRMLEVLDEVGFFDLKAYEGLMVKRIDRYAAVDAVGSVQARLCLTFRRSGDVEGRAFPSDVCDAIKVYRRIVNDVAQYHNLNGRKKLDLIVAADALRRTNVFLIALEAIEMFNGVSYMNLRSDVQRLKETKLGHLVPAGISGPSFGVHIDVLRVNLLNGMLKL